MSFAQSTVGQFACALNGTHKVSEADEQKLYDCPDAEIETTCQRCGAPLHLRIDPEDDKYMIIES